MFSKFNEPLLGGWLMLWHVKYEAKRTGASLWNEDSLRRVKFSHHFSESEPPLTSTSNSNVIKSMTRERGYRTNEILPGQGIMRKDDPLRDP
jgi:hypothetical protein